MPCEYAYAVHFLNFTNHGGKHFSSGFLCAFRLGKFCKNFHIFSTRIFPQFKELRLNRHYLMVIIFGALASVEKIFWFEHIHMILDANKGFRFFWRAVGFCRVPPCGTRSCRAAKPRGNASVWLKKF